MKSSFCLGLMLIPVVIVGAARSEESNQRDVREGIEEGGWHVAYGRMITEAEYAQLTAAIAASVATENPSPVIAYLGDFAASTADKIRGQIPNMSRDIIIDNMKKCITKPDHSLTVGKLEVKFGVATYNRWHRVVYDTPELRMVRKERKVLGRRIVYHEPEMVNVRHETHIPLPNWHQPYIGVKIR